MNKIDFIKSKYLSNYIIFDIFLIILFYFIYIHIPYKYFEIPPFISGLYAIFFAFLSFNSEKINRFKKDKNFKEILMTYIIYMVTFLGITFVLKTYLLNIGYFSLNILISILTVVFLRLAIFGIFLFILWINSKKK